VYFTETSLFGGMDLKISPPTSETSSFDFLRHDHHDDAPSSTSIASIQDAHNHLATGFSFLAESGSENGSNESAISENGSSFSFLGSSNNVVTESTVRGNSLQSGVINLGKMSAAKPVSDFDFWFIVSLLRIY